MRLRLERHLFTIAAIAVAALVGLSATKPASDRAKLAQVAPYSGPATPKQYGAKGDDIADDTLAIRKAVNAVWQGGGGEVLFTHGDYLLSETIVFGVGVHIRGETLAQSRVTVTKDGIDAFRTFEADQLLRTGKDSGYFDEDLIFEGLTVNLPMSGTNGSALVLKQPGEASCVRNLHLNGGQHGIVALGMGAPGLRVRDCTISNTRESHIYVQGWVGGNWLGYGGPASFIGVSGDNRRADANAALIEFDRCYGPVTVNGCKAEGTFTKGVIHYTFGQREKTGKSLDRLAAIAISESTANINSPDYLVLDSDGGPRVPSAIIQNVNVTGAKNTIRNAFTGETLPSTNYLQGLRPIYYGDQQ